MCRQFIIVTIAAVSAMAPIAAADVGEQISVEELGGVYHVVARFAVPQPPDAVLHVLTDYEQIPRFMPDLQSSVVRERVGCRVVVEQEAIAKMIMFSKRIHLLLEVHEERDALRFVDQSGTSFSQYEGAWRVTAQAQGSQVSYELTAKPAFSVPQFLLTRLLRRDARQMIERLRREIASRPAGIAAR